MPKRQPMPRRTFLRTMVRGSAIAVGLPMLESMLNTNGTALAQGEPIPTRFGVFFWGNGVIPTKWIPSGTGGSWSLSEEMAPLTAVKNYISPVTGCAIQTDTGCSGASCQHHKGPSGILSGAAFKQLGTKERNGSTLLVTTFNRPSVDQIAADYLGTTPVRALHIRITNVTESGLGTSMVELSHNGPNSVNPPFRAPSDAFQHLFGTEYRSDQERQSRRSVLDYVNGQITSLKNNASAEDRARLDGHFESVRDLELRLESVAPECTPPTPAPDPQGQQFALRSQLMTEILRVALACDLTRTFTFQFSHGAWNSTLAEAGNTSGMHGLAHSEPGGKPQLNAAIIFIMERFAQLLTALRDTPEGTGNLLDNCSILASSALGNGGGHRTDEYPIIIAGKGSGRLRGNIHHRVVGGNASRATLTALRGAGVGVSSFGGDSGVATSTFGALET